MYTYTTGHRSDEPKGGWLHFYQNMRLNQPEVWARKNAFREAHENEFKEISTRRQELLRELAEIDNRQHWLEGLEEVVVGRATVRSRREGLIVYAFRNDSPTGVSSLPGCTSDTPEHRAEVASAGSTVYAGAY